jgi:hypothetical protein
VDLTIISIVPDSTTTPLTVAVTVSESLATGNVCEVSYAWYYNVSARLDGPGINLPGTPGYTSMGGNLRMRGTQPSLFFAGKTIDAWACPFASTITL